MMNVKEFTEQVLSKRGQLPHCDMFVLHRPGTCDYCDLVPELQEYRLWNRINFTNEEEPDLADCPSWENRHRLTIERWGGNIPHVDIGKLRSSCICYPNMCPQGCEPACPVC